MAKVSQKGPGSSTPCAARRSVASFQHPKCTQLSVEMHAAGDGQAVDFAACRKTLARLQEEIAAGQSSKFAMACQLARNPRDPRLKLFVTWQALQFRHEHADLFHGGDYIPLNVRGSRAKHVCAFARNSVSCSGSQRKVAVIVVPRLIAQLTPPPANAVATPPPLGPAIWEDTQVLIEDAAGISLEDLFTGEMHLPEDGLISVGRALSDFPVALLTAR